MGDDLGCFLVVFACGWEAAQLLACFTERILRTTPVLLILMEIKYPILYQNM